MSYLEDLRGKRFGRLVVIDKADCPDGMQKKRRYWKCLCDCGNEKIASTKLLKAGLTKSCGCLAHDILIERNAKHGKFGSRIYNIWAGMKSRCLNENDPKYPIYGGRGIRICEEWKSFEPFYEWAKNGGYSDELSIDRIDVNGNYEPSNCRWATPAEQSNNKRCNRFISAYGKTMTVAEWAALLGVPAWRIYARLKRGWTDEQAISLGKFERRSDGNIGK